MWTYIHMHCRSTLHLFEPCIIITLLLPIITHSMVQLNICFQINITATILSLLWSYCGAFQAVHMQSHCFQTVKITSILWLYTFSLLHFSIADGWSKTMSPHFNRVNFCTFTNPEFYVDVAKNVYLMCLYSVHCFAHILHKVSRTILWYVYDIGASFYPSLENTSFFIFTISNHSWAQEAPELSLLPVWSFVCSPRVHGGFFWACWLPPASQKHIGRWTG